MQRLRTQDQFLQISSLLFLPKLQDSLWFIKLILPLRNLNLDIFHIINSSFSVDFDRGLSISDFQQNRWNFIEGFRNSVNAEYDLWRYFSVELEFVELFLPHSLIHLQKLLSEVVVQPFVLNQKLQLLDMPIVLPILFNNVRDAGYASFWHIFLRQISRKRRNDNIQEMTLQEGIFLVPSFGRGHIDLCQNDKS